jgi:hypothetical protein
VWQIYHSGLQVISHQGKDVSKEGDVPDHGTEGRGRGSADGHGRGGGERVRRRRSGGGVVFEEEEVVARRPMAAMVDDGKFDGLGGEGEAVGRREPPKFERSSDGLPLAGRGAAEGSRARPAPTRGKRRCDLDLI